MELSSAFHWDYVRPKNPVMMYTPWPETFRYGASLVETFFSRILNFLFYAGMHPYRDMSVDSISKLLLRPVEILPIADEYLESFESELITPWEYTTPVTILKWRLKKYLKAVKLYAILKKFGLLSRKINPSS